MSCLKLDVDSCNHEDHHHFNYCNNRGVGYIPDSRYSQKVAVRSLMSLEISSSDDEAEIFHIHLQAAQLFGLRTKQSLWRLNFGGFGSFCRDPYGAGLLTQCVRRSYIHTEICYSNSCNLIWLEEVQPRYHSSPLLKKKNPSILIRQCHIISC